MEVGGRVALWLAVVLGEWGRGGTRGLQGEVCLQLALQQGVFNVKIYGSLTRALNSPLELMSHNLGREMGRNNIILKTRPMGPQGLVSNALQGSQGTATICLWLAGRLL